MGLIGGIIGGVGSAVAGIVGGNAVKKAAQRNEKLIREAEDQAKSWYEKEYNSSYLDRADAKAAINQAREMLKDRYASAEGAAAVTGATEESIARQKAANNAVVADVTSSIAASADAYKDSVRANYEGQMDAVRAQKTAMNNQKAQATLQAAQGLAQAANSLGSGVDDYLGAKFKKNQPQQQNTNG